MSRKRQSLETLDVDALSTLFVDPRLYGPVVEPPSTSATALTTSVNSSQQMLTGRRKGVIRVVAEDIRNAFNNACIAAYVRGGRALWSVTAGARGAVGRTIKATIKFLKWMATHPLTVILDLTAILLCWTFMVPWIYLTHDFMSGWSSPRDLLNQWQEDLIQVTRESSRTYIKSVRDRSKEII